jgi:hypothetical protein
MSIINTNIEGKYHPGGATAYPVYVDTYPVVDAEYVSPVNVDVDIHTLSGDVDVLIGTPVIENPAARVNPTMPTPSMRGRIMGNTNLGFSFNILKEPKRASLTFMKIVGIIGYLKLLSISS